VAKAELMESSGRQGVLPWLAANRDATLAGGLE
jgi:hypothetical protein